MNLQLLLVSFSTSDGRNLQLQLLVFVGLTDGSNPCCTTWKNETSACIPDLEPCKDPNKHVFWDAFHLTETVYSIVASRCVRDKTMCTPMSIQELVKM